MFLLSKKGFLLLIGTGLLLSTVPPSGAIKCYHCLSHLECDKPMVEEWDCTDVKMCKWSFDTTQEDHVATEARRCNGHDEEDEEVGCKLTGILEVCHCATDLCNTNAISDVLHGRQAGENDEESKSGGGATAGTYLIVILGNTITARGILPGGRNTG